MGHPNPVLVTRIEQKVAHCVDTMDRTSVVSAVFLDVSIKKYFNQLIVGTNIDCPHTSNWMQTQTIQLCATYCLIKTNSLNVQYIK